VTLHTLPIFPFSPERFPPEGDTFFFHGRDFCPGLKCTLLPSGDFLSFLAIMHEHLFFFVREILRDAAGFHALQYIKSQLFSKLPFSELRSTPSTPKIPSFGGEDTSHVYGSIPSLGGFGILPLPLEKAPPGRPPPPPRE